MLRHGGIVVARAAGMREGMVSRGVMNLEAGCDPPGRVRRPSAGRKKLADLNPGRARRCWRWSSRTSVGIQYRRLRWMTKSTRNLARELTTAGHRCSVATVAALLLSAGFSL